MNTLLYFNNIAFVLCAAYYKADTSDYIIKAERIIRKMLMRRECVKIKYEEIIL